MHSVTVSTLSILTANAAPQGITQLNLHAQPCWHSTVNSLVLALFDSFHHASVKQISVSESSIRIRLLYIADIALEEKTHTKRHQNW